MTLFELVFWRQIGWALVRTGLAGIVPFLPGLTSDPAGTWPAAVGTVGLLLVVTVATSMSGIATPDTAPWWQVLMSRGLLPGTRPESGFPNAFNGTQKEDDGKPQSRGLAGAEAAPGVA